MIVWESMRLNIPSTLSMYDKKGNWRFHTGKEGKNGLKFKFIFIYSITITSQENEKEMNS